MLLTIVMYFYHILLMIMIIFICRDFLIHVRIVSILRLEVLTLGLEVVSLVAC